MAKSKYVALGTGAAVLLMAGAALLEENVRNAPNARDFGNRTSVALPMEIANQLVGVSKETLSQTSTLMLQGLYWAGATGLAAVSSAVAGLTHRFCCAKKPMDSSVAGIEAHLAEEGRVNREGQHLLSPNSRK